MPINTSFLNVFILSFWGIRQAHCPYAFRFSEIYEKNSNKFLRLKSGREREKEKREKEKAEKIGEIGEIRPIREEKRERTHCVRSLCSPTLLAFLGSCTRSDSYIHTRIS